MTTFEKLFGVDAGQIKPRCVLLPQVNRDFLNAFGISHLKRGNLYGVGQSKDFSLIHTGLGAPLTGDAVLYLKETSCQDLFLFGSCGSLGRLGIGTLVTVIVCREQESFSAMLLGTETKNLVSFYPDRGLTSAFLEKKCFRSAACLSVSSLKLEEERLGDLQTIAVDVVDMECSSFFSAASFIKRRALSLLCVRDIVKERPFYDALSLDEKKAFNRSLEAGAKALSDFMREKP